MKERPILFSAPMVRALLDGSKTQTRRIVKSRYHIEYLPLDLRGPIWPHNEPYCDFLEAQPMNCHYGQPGDRLWVRETFIQGWPSVDQNPDQFDEDGNEKPIHTWYRATSPELGWMDDDGGTAEKTPWKPSIHMPRAASRITLEIVSVRVEQLQDISEADARAEGIFRNGVCAETGLFRNYLDAKTGFVNPIDSYQSLWESINGPGSWDLNPWVWALEFKRVEGSAP